MRRSARLAQIPKPPAKRPGSFTFLSLPAELRQLIYTHALVDAIPLTIFRNGNYITGVHSRPGFRHESFTPNPSPYPCAPRLTTLHGHVSLLRISRAVHTEASAILYGQNTFAFSHADEAPAFLRALPSYAARLARLQIKWVQLHVPRGEAEFFDALGPGVARVRVLLLFCKETPAGALQRDFRRWFEALRGVLVARARRDGRVSAGLDVVSVERVQVDRVEQAEPRAWMERLEALLRGWLREVLMEGGWLEGLAEVPAREVVVAGE